MDELLDRVRSCVEEITVDASESEEADGEVLREEFVQTDDLEVLDHSDLVLAQITEED